MAAAAPVPGDHMANVKMGIPPGAIAVHIGDLELECGAVLRDVVLAASTYGALNERADNAVVVGHSLTSSSNTHEWWPEMLGPTEDKCLDTTKFFVVCFNYLGSCYGSTSPITTDAYPSPVTMRDQARAQIRGLLRMGVRGLALAIGGSMGGMLALEIALEAPAHFTRAVCVVAGCARHTDWATGHSEVQRQAIFADPKWRQGRYPPHDPPRDGLEIARMAAMLTYRTPASFTSKFGRKAADQARSQRLHQRAGILDRPHAAGAGDSSDTSEGVREASSEEVVDTPSVPEPSGNGIATPSAASAASPTGSSHAGSSGAGVWVPHWSVESYLHHQGAKFIERFDARCYVALTHTLDTHDIGRGRGDVDRALASLAPRPLLVVGVDSDALYPLELQESMARACPSASLAVLHSPHGHDGFLIEIRALNRIIREWLAVPARAPSHL